MTLFNLVAEGIDTAPVLEQLAANPQLWDQYTLRKTEVGSPHGGMSDIWVRYNDIAKFSQPIDRAAFNSEHMPIMYPAWHALPALRPIVLDLMARVGAVHLGAVLITRIPPGGRIEPHVDGGWHAEYHNCKIYGLLKSNPGCVNRCEGEAVNMKAGEAWSFDNLRVHSVENNGDSERITAIVCMRVE